MLWTGLKNLSNIKERESFRRVTLQLLWKKEACCGTVLGKITEVAQAHPEDTKKRLGKRQGTSPPSSIFSCYSIHLLFLPLLPPPSLPSSSVSPSHTSPPSHCSKQQLPERQRLNVQEVLNHELYEDFISSMKICEGVSGNWSLEGKSSGTQKNS